VSEPQTRCANSVWEQGAVSGGVDSLSVPKVPLSVQRVLHVSVGRLLSRLGAQAFTGISYVKSIQGGGGKANFRDR
jgi:hypothetical protein